MIQQLKENYFLSKKEIPLTLEEKVERLFPGPRQSYDIGSRIDELKRSKMDNITIAKEAVKLLRPQLLAELETKATATLSN